MNVVYDKDWVNKVKLLINAKIATSIGNFDAYIRSRDHSSLKLRPRAGPRSGWGLRGRGLQTPWPGPQEVISKAVLPAQLPSPLSLLPSAVSALHS